MTITPGFRKGLNWVSILLIMSGLPSCKSLTSSDLFKTGSQYKYADFKPSEKEYRIQPFDKIDMKIYTNDGYKLIDMAVVQHQQAPVYGVEFDGQVKLPSLGRVNLAGKTVREAELELETLYSQIFIDPFVMVTVTNKRVIVFSGGSSNGSVLEMKNDNYTLIEALADAGGISEFSKSYRIKLLRGDLNNPEIFVFNIRNVADMQHANFILQANDIIYVDARPRYASRIVSEISPYLSLMSSVLLVYALFLK
jgi:polysaccharide export outer membrane protein